MTDLSAMKQKLTKLKEGYKKKGEASKYLWRPTPGKYQIRIVPLAQSPDNPFMELLFHYRINGKNYISPKVFGRRDFICEFADKLKSSGDKDDFVYGCRCEPKTRTFAMVIVRGEEDKGVRLWGFGKTVYQDLLSTILDEDYGDITDVENGNDIAVEVIPAESEGDFQKTTIRAKPKKTVLSDNPALMKEWLSNQPKIEEVFQEPSYDELREAFEIHLNKQQEKNTAETDTKDKVTESASNDEKPSVEANAPKILDKSAVSDRFNNVFGKK